MKSLIGGITSTLGLRRAIPSAGAAFLVFASLLAPTSASAQAGKRAPVNSKNAYRPHEDPQLGKIEEYTENYTSKEKRDALKGASDVHETTRPLPGSTDLEVSFHVQKGSDGYSAFIQLKPGVQGPVKLKAYIKDKELCTLDIKAAGDEFQRVKVVPKIGAEVKFVLSSPGTATASAAPAPPEKKPLGSSLSAPATASATNNLVDISVHKERPAGALSGGGIGLGG